MQTSSQIEVSKRPLFLVEPPSITCQTDWDCGFYDLPPKHGMLDCVHFNCGIANWLNADWLVTRTQTRPARNRFLSRICFWLLQNNVPERDSTTVVIDTAYPDEQAEDPRVMVVGDRLFLSWVAWRYARPGNFAHQVFGELDHGFRVRLPQHVEFGKNGDHLHRNKGFEKNWIWFHDERGWHFVYSMQPHTVCDVVDGMVVNVNTTSGDQRVWTYGEQRGGTPPVRVGDEYFSFFHSSVAWMPPYRRYFAGCYAFSADPPYEVTGITSYPLLFGSKEDARVDGTGPLVVFPCGALFRNGEWLVTLGVNDCRSAWIRLSHVGLMENMVSV